MGAQRAITCALLLIAEDARNSTGLCALHVVAGRSTGRARLFRSIFLSRILLPPNSFIKSTTTDISMQTFHFSAPTTHSVGHANCLAALRPTRWQRPLQTPLRAKADEPKETSSGNDSYSVLSSAAKI